MTYRSEWSYLRRNLLSIEVRIAETQLKIDSEKAESKLYEKMGGAKNHKASLKHKAKERCYEVYMEELVKVREKYLNTIRKSIINYMSNDRASMWWDMFMKNLKTSELSKKYNLIPRQINRYKQSFIEEIGNDGSISEIEPYRKTAQRKNNNNK